MNTPVRRVAIAVMAMVLLLMGNLTYVQVVQAGEQRHVARNQRGVRGPELHKHGQNRGGGGGHRT